jgi:signal transduction histidine kinase
MKPRQKRFLTYFLLCVAPLLLLAAVNYWIASSLNARAVSDGLQESINSLAVDIDEDLRIEETQMRRVASSEAVKQFLANHQVSTRDASVPAAERASPDKTSDKPLVDLRVIFSSLLNEDGKVSRLALFDSNRLLVQAERSSDPSEVIVIKTTDLPAQRLSPDTLQHDEFTRIPNTTILRFAAPASPNRFTSVAALVGDVNLEELLLDSARLTAEAADPQASSISIVWNADGKVLYHPNPSYRGRPLSEVVPQLSSLSGVGQGSLSSNARFQTSSGRDYLLAYSPLPRLGVTIALARDVSELTSSIRTWGLAGFGLAVALALVSALLVESFVQRKTSGLERVTEGLTAVAKGELDHRVELRSSDEARAVADDLRVLTERLRSQLAREAETQQFESFFRLSAMLTHDLKNAIEALSLTVGNMERHFDNEQFRIDAMKSLTSATNKLKALVARLSRPITSLSGEHRLPRRIDLVPVLTRAIKSNLEPTHGRHEIQLKLPTELFAVTAEEHIEEVFENLLLNSLEAMSHKSGKITIEAETSRDETVIRITDTGCGMSQSFIENSLFRPFKTTKKNGIGLGLYTCQEVVKASAGRIEVESAEGIGTTFRVVLPSGT